MKQTSPEPYHKPDPEFIEELSALLLSGEQTRKN
jgi:hypothetical protein